MSLFQSTFNFYSKITRWGGYAIKMINDTRAPTVEGCVVKISTNVANGFQLVPTDEPSPIGCVLDAGVPDGDYAWISVSGRAKILTINAVAQGTFCRVCVSDDAGAQDGRVVSEAFPSAPFASDKHFQECGHFIDNIPAAGLAFVDLHFN